MKKCIKDENSAGLTVSQGHFPNKTSMSVRLNSPKTDVVEKAIGFNSLGGRNDYIHLVLSFMKPVKLV